MEILPRRPAQHRDLEIRGSGCSRAALVRATTIGEHDDAGPGAAVPHVCNARLFAVRRMGGYCNSEKASITRIEAALVEMLRTTVAVIGI
jgi:hypothetical protein